MAGSAQSYFSALSLLACASANAGFEQTVRPFFAKYCHSCHNSKANSGGLNLDDFNSAGSMETYRDEWGRILQRISLGQMPPRQAPRPEGAEIEAVTRWIQEKLDRVDASKR